MRIMPPGAERTKVAPISRHDLENSFCAWQMSCDEYVHESRKCQVNAAFAEQPGGRLIPGRDNPRWSRRTRRKHFQDRPTDAGRFRGPESALSAQEERK